MQLLKQTQNPSKIRHLDCSSLVDFSEILKIMSEYIFVGMFRITVIKMSMRLVF